MKANLAIAQQDQTTREETGFAIIGPYGTIWTDQVFADAVEAQRHIDHFWGSNLKNTVGYSLAPATLTINITGDERIPLRTEDAVSHDRASPTREQAREIADAMLAARGEPRS